MSFIVPHYLDACVAVKIVCREKGSAWIEEYIRTNASFMFHMTEYAFYETLGVLKRKWKKREISDAKYTEAISVLEAYLDEGLIELDADFKPHDRRLICELGDLVKKHKIDYSDALQIYTILNGRTKGHVYESKTVLVTEDKDLVKAAEAEGLRLWHFPDGEAPQSNWA
ncbi:MAG TPA: type II toxin-antitoxin system VapC family toxin [Opitutaceae bacterium]|nr:type II toxin-antitoxin system VapC family toxin [Opitutaceae bacterium]